MKKIIVGLIGLISIVLIIFLVFQYNENFRLLEKYQNIIAEKEKNENILNAKIKNLNAKLSEQGMTLSKFKKLTNIQLYQKLKKDQYLFNQNVQTIQTKFQELISKMGILHAYFQPLTENSALITSSASAISFIVPGVDSLNGAIDFIANVDRKISSYIVIYKCY